ncbi:MAG: type II toxin-antitoxin system PemK/MazF family toxin [Elusimicrobia bacterium]|nr:type II toxin-antitoxin system PemK/MazF family toxin [Elusimicrobiota bacterium]
MRRGEVWWSQQPLPIGRRPVVLLSRDEAYAVRNAVTVAQVTIALREIPVEVPLGPKEGLPQSCVVNLDTITTIPKSMLIERLSGLPAEKIEKIDRAIRFALALPD